MESRAAPERAWWALAHVLSRAFGGTVKDRVARLLGCRDRAAGPFVPVAGATLAGFRVVRAAPPARLALEGEHRFARYALAFRIAPTADGSRIAAETRAIFPGLRGRLYRALVVESGGHALVTRRILRGIARRAERDATPSRTSGSEEEEE